MIKRGSIFLAVLLTLAACGSEPTEIESSESATTSAPEAEVEASPATDPSVDSTDADAEVEDVADVDAAQLDEPEPTEETTTTTIPLTDDELAVTPEPDDGEEGDPTEGSPYTALAADIAESDFQLSADEEQCLSGRLVEVVTVEEAETLVATIDSNLEPDDPRTPSILATYETIANCMGADRVVDVLLEPEYNPEGHECFLNTFTTEQEQIDAAVAFMLVEFADLPEAPGDYQAIIEKFDAASCGEAETAAVAVE